MSLVFRDQQVMVVSPGSQTTLVQMGLAESLLPALLETPTRVYRADGGRFLTEGAANAAVEPLKGGAIVDEPAFHFFLKSVYRSAAPEGQPPPALYLVSSTAWNHGQLERMTRYLFEEVGVPALAVCLHGVSIAYAYATPNALVIDIGYDKTEISAVVDSDVDLQASRIAPVGGNCFNKRLAELLPDLSAEQIEDLKLSGIVEVLVSGNPLALALDPDAIGAAQKPEEEDGVVDVAAIVTSGRTREILEQRERELSGQASQVRPNAELETNSFTDRHGKEHQIGRERFQGSDALIDAIVETVDLVHSDLPPQARQLVWDQLIITGRGSAVPGLKAKLLAQLEAEFLVSKPLVGSDPAPIAAELPGVPRQTPSDADYPTQAPTTIRLAKMADHFPEWKADGWNNVGFLGAQIAAKQTYTSGIENLFISRQDYNEVGPSAAADY